MFTKGLAESNTIAVESFEKIILYMMQVLSVFLN
jgi:hypothetical protein